MPLSHQEFLDEIQKHKEQQGLLTTDDDYRKKHWLPYLPIDHKAVRLQHLRQNWTPAISEVDAELDRHRMRKVEKPTRIVKKGFIVGVGKPVPRYINRGPPVAKEFQGARVGRTRNVPYYPANLANPTVNYLSRRNSLIHRKCLQVDKDSATLWRDMINSTLENNAISGEPMWYNPLISTAEARFHQRWPLERRKMHRDQYFAEFCQLFHRPSRVFVLDWIDDQLVFPHVGYTNL